jgi:predicted glycoside hydrolase/deacetylase ChbG (UPF0249 family)
MSEISLTVRLATRGDDAGVARSANRALREAAEHGMLRNISLMACTPFIADAYSQLSGLTGVAFGCHATINAEWDEPRWGPVLPARAVPSLVGPDGMFLATPAETHARGVAVDEVMAEIEAQVACLRKLGFRLAYLDFHMCFQWFPGLQARVTDLCRRERLLDVDSLGLKPPQTAGAPTADQIERWRLSLEQAVAGDYRIVTHPCCDDDEMRAFRGSRVGVAAGTLGVARDVDRRLLLDPVALATVQRRGIHVVTFSELGEGR